MESKPWYLSKTLWGLAVAAVAMLLQWRFGIKIGDQGLVTDEVVNVASSIVQVIGVGLAAYGRVKATTTLVKQS